MLEPDSAGRGLLESLGYGAVRVFRELRIQLEAPPAAPEWPGGLRILAFDPERDAREFTPLKSRPSRIRSTRRTP